MNALIIVFAIFGQTSIPAESSLEFSGTPGVKIMGTCFTNDGVQEKKFEAVTPSEVALEIGVQKCSISTPEKKAKVKVRLFQNRKILLHHDLETPSSGFEISIPLGKSKKQP